MFEEILHTLEMGYSHENLLYACSIFHHYLGTLRYLQQYREAIQQDSNTTDIITETIHYMKENIERKLTLKEIAKHTGYSISYFSALFSQRTGYAPLVYFNMLKIQQACSLLDFTNTLNPQLHSRSATYIKRNGLLIRKITIKSSRPFQCAYHPLTP